MKETVMKRGSRCIAALALLVAACSSGRDDRAPTLDEDTSDVLELTATQDGDRHRFVLSRDTVPQGWTTLRFANASSVDHFALLSRLPEGHGIEDYRDQVTRVAQNMLDQMLLQRSPTFENAPRELPTWYSDVEVMGGPGLTSPGHVSETILRLRPGTYVLECYVKTPDGYFHHAVGMLAPLVVSQAEAGTSEPAPNLEVTLTNTGIEAEDTVAAGEQTVAVHFAEQQQYPNLSQNDVHLARVGEDTSLESLSSWLDAMAPEGLVSPPGPATFLGGVQEMQAGTTAYLVVDLEPGRYAWVSEVPDPLANDMLRTFVAEPSG